MNESHAPFPAQRPRRLRHHPLVRELGRETTLSVADLIYPLFVRPGRGIKKEIASMPGNYQFSVDRLVDGSRSKSPSTSACAPSFSSAFHPIKTPPARAPWKTMASSSRPCEPAQAFGDKALLLDR